jgi:hypothetical protein
MAKAKGKTKSRKGNGKRGMGSTKTVDIAAVRHMITRMVTLQAGDMVKAVIEEAKKGHSPSLKYLFEMIGLYPATLETQQAEKREMSLAELFCRELGLPIQAPEVAREEEHGEAGSMNDAVE